MSHQATISRQGALWDGPRQYPWRSWGPIWVGLLFLLALLLLPAAVHGEESGGQDGVAPAPRSRVAAWRALRQDKARDMEESEESLLGRIVGPVRNLVRKGGELNIKPVLHGGHQHNSPAIGFRFLSPALGYAAVHTRMQNRADLMIEATASADGHNHAEAQLGVHRFLSLRPLRATLVAEYNRHPHDDFFGLGGDSVRADRSTYRLTTFEAGATLEWRLTGDLSLQGGGSLLSVSTGPGGGAGPPSVGQVFSGDRLPGFDDHTSFLRSHAAVVLDWRDEPELPHRGGLVALGAEDFEELSTSRFDFQRYRFEVQHYFPFFHEQRVLVLRGLTVLTEPHSDGQVPFYLMPTLGHGDALRGYDSFRFRDRYALLMQGEYRWAAWEGIEMALFLDAGKVFPDLDQFNLHDLKTGYGLGFRFQGPRQTVFRVDIARSSERIRPHVSFRHVF